MVDVRRVVPDRVHPHDVLHNFQLMRNPGQNAVSTNLVDAPHAFSVMRPPSNHDISLSTIAIFPYQTCTYVRRGPSQPNTTNSRNNRWQMTSLNPPPSRSQEARSGEGLVAPSQRANVTFHGRRVISVNPPPNVKG